MKTAIVSLALLLASVVAQAGSPPTTSCTNQGATIEISQGEVSVLTTTDPSNTYEKFDLSDLNVAEVVIQQMPVEKYGCTSRSVVFKHVALTKKDGSKMPDAYNRLVQNGSLNDYFVCATSSAWMPTPGHSCF